MYRGTLGPAPPPPQTERVPSPRGRVHAAGCIINFERHPFGHLWQSLSLYCARGAHSYRCGCHICETQGPEIIRSASYLLLPVWVCLPNVRLRLWVVCCLWVFCVPIALSRGHWTNKQTFDTFAAHSIDSMGGIVCRNSQPKRHFKGYGVLFMRLNCFSDQCFSVIDVRCSVC